MGAKDTVDYKKAWEAMNGGGKECTAPIKLALECQAEITWGKAIREVVEWIDDTDIVVMLSPRKRREWQAKLKEWGVRDVKVK